MGQKSSPKITSQAGRIVMNQTTDQFLVYDANNNPIALMGYDSTGAIVMKVAQAGENVITAPDSELVFNSEYNTLRIVESGSTNIATLTATNGNEATSTFTYTFTGEYALPPIVLAFTGNQSGLLNNSFIPLSYGWGPTAPMNITGALITSLSVSNRSFTLTQKVVNSDSGGSISYPGYSLFYYVLSPSITIF